MIEIQNKEDCSGCTACANICPKNCIEMVEDKEGFLYPEVDVDRCVNCGLCDKVCPEKNINLVDSEPEAIILRTKAKGILESSTSGGAFTPIAKHVLDNNGIVYGVGFDRKNNVVHMSVDANSRDKLKEFRGSKYVQSYLGDTFTKIIKQLEDGVLVCFTGTPCQVAGLKNFLKKDYDNLICIDFLCRGVPSPRLWREYIKYQKKRYKSDIKKIFFRYKTYGYHSSTMRIEFENSKIYSQSGKTDLMLKSFFKELCSRPSCHQCSFKTISRVSDFTMFDGWHYEKLVNGKKDDNRGYTILLSHSDRGKKLFDKIKNAYTYYEVSLDEAILYDGIMAKNSSKPNKKRNLFFEMLNQEISIDRILKKIEPISIIDRISEQTKPFLYRLGMMQKIKKLKDK